MKTLAPTPRKALRGVLSHRARPHNDDVARRHARHAIEQNASPSVVAHQGCPSNIGSHSPGDFTHGLEDGEVVLVLLDHP